MSVPVAITKSTITETSVNKTNGNLTWDSSLPLTWDTAGGDTWDFQFPVPTAITKSTVTASSVSKS